MFLKRKPSSLIFILVPLPNFRDEAGRRRVLIDELEEFLPIEFTFFDLKALAIYAGGVSDMQMCCVWPDLSEKVTERLVQVIASQLRVRYTLD